MGSAVNVIRLRSFFSPTVALRPKKPGDLPEWDISEAEFERTVRCDAKARVRVIGTPDGFVVVLHSKGRSYVLAKADGKKLRYFTLEGARRLLYRVSAAVFTVDTSFYKEGRVRKARPDRSAALKKTGKGQQVPGSAASPAATTKPRSTRSTSPKPSSKAAALARRR